MKKTDVYVVVDTPKKAKKLKRVLDMFGEKLYRFDTIEHCLNNNKMMAFSKNWNWFALGFTEKETEVSIKELRNILAKEHLKAGDICLFDDRKGFKSIGVFDKYSEEYTDFLVSKVPGRDSVRYGFPDFIRYATEEEKDLLEPKKELEFGKWYRLQNNNLIFATSELSRCHVYGYGFSHGGKLWSDEYPNFLVQEFTEATLQEVEKALIKEAKRRGHNYKEYEYNPEENELCGIKDGRLESVFCDGCWEQPASNFTDSDVAIVERLHDALLDNHGYSLESKLLTDARMLANKIKSNIK